MERATFVRYYARLSKQSLNVWIEFSRWINRASNAFTLLHSIFNFISIWQLSVSHPKFRSLFASSISTRWWRKLEFDHFLHFKFLVFILMIFLWNLPEVILFSRFRLFRHFTLTTQHVRRSESSCSAKGWCHEDAGRWHPSWSRKRQLSSKFIHYVDFVLIHFNLGHSRPILSVTSLTFWEFFLLTRLFLLFLCSYFQNLRGS